MHRDLTYCDHIVGAHCRADPYVRLDFIAETARWTLRSAPIKAIYAIRETGLFNQPQMGRLFLLR